MRVCFFGTYVTGAGYPVNRFLIDGLRAAGAAVTECRAELWPAGPLHATAMRPRVARWLALLQRLPGTRRRLAQQYRDQAPHECVVVGYPGYLDMGLARRLARRRHRLLLLVAFISLYDTLIVDRQRWRPRGCMAWLLLQLDRYAFRRADLVLVDTHAQARHYAALLDMPLWRFHRSFVGHEFAAVADLEPAVADRTAGEFRVLFFGTYVPLHGVDVILEAAALLTDCVDMRFELIGNGQLYPAMRATAARLSLANVSFVDQWLNATDLAARVQAADVCLGIFGTTDKAARVIPYKVLGSLALGRPVVTRDSPAIRELLVNRESALLCAPGDGAALARALLELRAEPELAARVAAAGRATYGVRASGAAVGRELVGAIRRRVHGG
jgi:glycosyltransferase involved in cell wall biosynthesis